MKNGKLFLTLFITIIVLILGLKISKINPKGGMNLMQDKDSRRANTDFIIFLRL